VAFHGLKKSTTLNRDSFFNGTMIRDITSNKQVDPSANLLAGTAWLFADAALDQQHGCSDLLHFHITFESIRLGLVAKQSPP
jgi:hypothetical protein